VNLPQTTFIIFARYPHAGKVKTRLAATIGNDAAAHFYRLCAEHTFRQVAPFQSRSSLSFYCSEAADLSSVQKWIAPIECPIIAQSGDTLGERMNNAFDECFRNGAAKVVIIGTDAPDISSEILQLSIVALDTADVVIGPAVDGGYYLLGMNQLHKDLFDSVPWSTENVLRITIEKAQSHQLSVYLLPELRDIDTYNDIIAWRNFSNTATDSELFAFAQKI
jgi:rSAM/selenodomain-associated transferase 1